MMARVGYTEVSDEFLSSTFRCAEDLKSARAEIESLRARLAEVEKERTILRAEIGGANAEALLSDWRDLKARATSSEATVRELTRALEYEPTDADLEAAWVHGNIRCYALRPFLAEIRRRARSLTERRDG